MKQNAFYELLNEIITHINKDFQYNYNELESYLLQKHPEWHVFFDDPDAGNALVKFLESNGEIERETVKTFFEKMQMNK